MRRLLALPLLISCLVLGSCSYVWTYKFALKEDYEHSKLKGWILDPDIWNIERIKSGADSVLAKRQNFYVNLDFELPNKKHREDIYDLHIESINIKFYDLDTDTTLSLKTSYFYGLSGYDEINKSFGFDPDSAKNSGRSNMPTLFIPLEVDSVLLTFEVKLRQGTYFTYHEKDSKIENDSIALFDNVEPIRVLMELVLYKQTTRLGALRVLPTAHPLE